VGDYINFNGTIIRSDEPVISSDNRGFRYGDGIFETIRVVDNAIELSAYHFDRLFSGIQLLQFEKPAYTREMLVEQINDLCRKNNHQSAARVRLVIFRGKGGLYDAENHIPNYIIESWPLADNNREINKEGLHIDIFPDGRKAIDVFSNLKSNNYLLYAMGALYAKKNNLGDCFILNSQERICDSTIANIFFIKNKTIFTPPLSEGCVAGVMRRHLMNKLSEAGFMVCEKETDIEWVRHADEIFLTNSILGIRWVQFWGDQSFKNKITFDIYDNVIKNID